MSLKNVPTSQLYGMKERARKKGQMALYAALDREIKRREAAKGRS